MEMTIDDLQETVNRSLLDSDWDVLNDLVAPDTLITGPRGFMISREEWIGAHQDSGYRQVRLETSESQLHTYDGSGVRFDVVESECIFHGERIAGRFRCSQTWVTDHG
jgi:hypothetical protein